MSDNFVPGSVIGFSIAGIIWIFVTWKLIADKGWGKGFAFSVGGTLALFVGLVLIAVVVSAFAPPLLFMIFVGLWLLEVIPVAIVVTGLAATIAAVARRNQRSSSAGTQPRHTSHEESGPSA